jgi:3-oxoacyl-[acyl-carrier protein] reductase
VSSTIFDDLVGKVVLVTGAGSGIGLAVATRFLEAGAVVGANILPGDAEAEETLAELATRGTLHVVRADVSDSEQVETAVAAFIAEVGTVDVLVSNAGIGQSAPFLELTAADWDRMLDVHVKGAANVTRACLPGMVEQGFGRVLFTASELVGIGMEQLTHYSAAKGALVVFARSLAREVGRSGVTVNCVAPGPTATRMLMGSEAEWNDDYRKSIPVQEFGDPDNIAWTWLFLASDAGRFFTGQIVSPNGGVTMGM